MKKGKEVYAEKLCKRNKIRIRITRTVVGKVAQGQSSTFMNLAN